MRTFIVCLLALALAGCDSFATAPEGFTEGNVGGSTPTLRIVNGTSSSMTVYFSPCSQPDYGPARGTIAAYGERSWRLEAGCWDVDVYVPPYNFAPERLTLSANQVNTLSYSP